MNYKHLNVKRSFILKLNIDKMAEHTQFRSDLPIRDSLPFSFQNTVNLVKNL